jgi:hypothetical protein
MAFLRANGETRGYTNYWVAYPLAFLSGEELLFVPRLPYHADFRFTTRDDRYPAYGAAVAASERAAFIVTHHPALVARLRQALTARAVSFRQADIGEYHVLYDLSRNVSPADLGLGADCCP